MDSPISSEEKIHKVLLRVTKSQQKYPHNNTTSTVSIKTATLFLQKKATSMSSELHHCVRWSESARQNKIEKRLRRVHRDLIILRGRSKETKSGATQVLLAPITKTKTPAHNKGGQWLVSIRKSNKERTERNRTMRLKEGTRQSNRTLSPILKHQKQRPQSAHRLLFNQRNNSTCTNTSPIRQRPKSATSTNNRYNKYNRIEPGNTKEFIRLQKDSTLLLEKLRTQLKHARNDGLHLSGGNKLLDPAKGDVIKKLTEAYANLYQGVSGKLDIMLLK